MVGLAAQVMTQAGGDVKEGVWKSFIVLLTNAPELHAYAARRLYAALRDSLPSAQLSLVATATWYIGAPTPAVCILPLWLLMSSPDSLPALQEPRQQYRPSTR